MLDTAEGLKRVGSVCFIMCSLFASAASLFLVFLIKIAEMNLGARLKLQKTTRQTCYFINRMS